MRLEQELRLSETTGSTYFAELIEETEATSDHEIDELLQILESKKEEWAKLEISDRIALLDEVQKNLLEVKDRWVQAELEAKGVSGSSIAEGVEYLFVAQSLRAIRQFQRSLTEIQAQGRPAISGSITSAPGGKPLCASSPGPNGIG